MADYLEYKFEDTPQFINTFDELPLWSASFGLLLLKHLELRPNLTVVDVGCGAGFPLMELAQRLGPTSKCYGVDAWTNAANRTRQKIKNYGVDNVEMIDTSGHSFERERLDQAQAGISPGELCVAEQQRTSEKRPKKRASYRFHFRFALHTTSVVLARRRQFANAKIGSIGRAQRSADGDVRAA